MKEEEPTGFRVAVHQSLLRPRLALGAEPSLVYLSALVCSLAFATGDVRAYLLGGLSWVVILFILRWIAKHVDPMASEIYVRSTNYKRYTSAQPSIIAYPPVSHEMQ